MIKRLILFFIISISSVCFCNELHIDSRLKNAINYYFEDLIPFFYNGQEDFSKEMVICHTKYNFGMQGNGFSIMKGTDKLIFNFYYLINHQRQLVQAILLSRQEIEGKLYEYWIFNLSDNGTPYKYAYFYLTECNSLKEQRNIISISKKYISSYKLNEKISLNLEIKDLIVLYQIEPWILQESFKNTIYENKIVCWKGDFPYLRDMNLFEILYYKSLKKSKK